MDFAAFVRGIERRLIGYLRFATLSAADSEELFAQTCAELRRRWPTLAEAQREEALFKIARAAVERFNQDHQRPAQPDSDELSRELHALGAKAREALCAATFGPAARVSELGARMLKAAPAPSVSRQMRAARTTLKSLLLVAISLCLCLAPVAGFAALQSMSAAPAANRPPEDWLGDQISLATRTPSDSTYYKGALANVHAAGDARLRALALDFELLVPAKLPEGFALQSVELIDSRVSGLDFKVARLKYTSEGASLLLLEAEGGFPWLSEFNAQAGRHAISVQLHGTAVLVVSNAFSDDALEEIAASLRPQ